MLEVLPWELAFEEVDQHINDALQVIPPALFDTQMAVQAGVSWSPFEGSVISVRNVISVLLNVFFGKTQVNHENGCTVLVESEEEVFWFDVSMDELFFVQVPQPFNELNTNHDYGFEIEFFIALLEQFFEAGSEQIHNHDMVLVEGAVKIESGEADGPGVDLVCEVSKKFGLVLELGVFGLEGFHFDCDGLFSFEVKGEMDLAKGARINFVIELKPFCNDHGGRKWSEFKNE